MCIRDRLYVRLARVKIVSICLIALVITLLVIYIIIAIDKPVKAIVEGTRRVSNGDLDVYLPYDSEDEIGILTDSVNQLIERLKNIIDDEKYLFREIGSENFEVKSTCEQAYRGDVYKRQCLSIFSETPLFRWPSTYRPHF